jgi:hypothetical protein
LKIIYTPNPLSCKIELDDFDKRILRKNVYIDMLEDIIIDAKDHLEEAGGNYDKAVKILDTRFSDELTKELDEKVQEHLEELNGCHAGDCTCAPASCLKCWAEEFAEVPDYWHWEPNYDKLRMYYVQEAFRGHDDLDKAIENIKHEEAKRFLINYKKIYNRHQSLDALA